MKELQPLPDHSKIPGLRKHDLPAYHVISRTEPASVCLINNFALLCGLNGYQSKILCLLNFTPDVPFYRIFILYFIHSLLLSIHASIVLSMLYAILLGHVTTHAMKFSRADTKPEVHMK